MYLIARWRVHDNQYDTVLNLLPELVAETRSEPGNVLYIVAHNEKHQHEIMLVEGYASVAAHEAHRQSAHFPRIVVNGIVPLLEERELTELSELTL